MENESKDMREGIRGKSVRKGKERNKDAKIGEERKGKNRVGRTKNESKPKKEEKNNQG